MKEILYPPVAMMIGDDEVFTDYYFKYTYTGQETTGHHAWCNVLGMHRVSADTWGTKDNCDAVENVYQQVLEALQECREDGQIDDDYWLRLIEEGHIVDKLGRNWSAEYDSGIGESHEE